MKSVIAFFLRIIYKRYIIEIDKHPLYNGKLFSKIRYGKDYCFYVGRYKLLKCKKQGGYGF